MVGKKKLFVCISCGSESSKWHGKCPSCGEWNSIVETDSAPPERNKDNKIIPLSSINSSESKRIKTPIEEFNLICGGGIVPGSVILLSGEPGIGKSTLALQIASGFRCLYISGEESPAQLKQRANRLGISSENVLVSTNTCAEDIGGFVQSGKPDCIIIDSVQTLYSSEIPGSAGSVSQIREASAKIIEIAKKTGIPAILIGHITKEGSIAGPKILEHIVDTVLHFEGDFTREFRMIRASKNRFGSVNEIGLFRMTGSGLIEIKDKNNLFLNISASSPGSAVSAAIEGSRTILFEVQALVTFTSFSNPRRMSDGLDINRLILLTAVLEKHGFIKLNSHDIFINLAGGFHIHETAADLAVAISIASGLKDKPIPRDTGFLGEISLSGEIRPVTQCERRIMEFSKSRFKKIIIPSTDGAGINNPPDLEIIKVKNIYEAIDCTF